MHIFCGGCLVSWVSYSNTLSFGGFARDEPKFMLCLCSELYCVTCIGHIRSNTREKLGSLLM